MNRNRHPRLVFTAGILLLAFSGFSLLLKIQPSGASSLPHYETSSVAAGDGIEITGSSRFWDQDTLVVTTQLKNRDPDVILCGAELQYLLPEDDDQREEWESVPVPGFGNGSWYISKVLTGVSPEEANCLQVRLDTEYAWTDELSEYSFLVDSADHDALLQAWRDEFSGFPVVTVEPAEGDRVTYSVRTPDDTPRSLYGSILIEYMNGDECVFAATADYKGAHETDVSATGTYSPPCQLPSWTEVKAVPLCF